MITISVITINYNNHQGLERTIRSVISQTYPGIEYLVIDGGSNDGSKEVIERYEKRISYWVSERDKGIYHAMNKGINLATGDYLLFLNSGDEFFDSRSLNIFLQTSPAHDFVYGDLEFIEKAGSRTIIYPDHLRFSYFIHHSLPHPSCLIRKSCFERIGLYDEQMRIVSDWKFFVIGVCKYGFSYQHRKEVLSKFYDDGISSVPSSRERIWKEKEKVFGEHFAAFEEDYKELLELRQKWNKLQYLSPFKLIKRILRIRHK